MNTEYLLMQHCILEKMKRMEVFSIISDKLKKPAYIKQSVVYKRQTSSVHVHKVLRADSSCLNRNENLIDKSLNYLCNNIVI